MNLERKLPNRPFTPAEAAQAGLSGTTLRRMAAEGRVERVARGRYAKLDDEAAYDIELLTARLRAPRATICLTSALAHHSLVDAIPSRTDLALPRGTWRPTGQPLLHWHAFDERTFEVGRTTTSVPGTRYRIGLYSAERSLVDAFRLRSLTGYELAVEALRAWLKRRGSSPAELVGIARQIPRSEGPIRQALSFLT